MCQPSALGVIETMPWLNVRYHPGFAEDLTSWITTIERTGKLVQRVDSWPERRTLEHRSRLSADQVVQLERLVAAVDFGELANRERRGAVPEDVGSIAVSVKHAGTVLEFDVPLLYWVWARASGRETDLPKFDFDPALRLWAAVNRHSPHKLCDRNL